MRFRKIGVAVCLAAMTLTAASCGSQASSKSNQQLKQVNRNATRRAAYLPSNNVEFNNYNRAQAVYDSPSTIIWCSTTWGNPSAPIVTIPVAGKLTSSSVSYFPNQVVEQYSDSGSYNPELRSVDGMFHGNPPPYRYGFTPGGQYVDFFNMPTVCTTALSKFQRQKTQVSITVDPDAQVATTKAEAALKAGTDSTGKVSASAQAEAQRILSGANLGG